MLKMFSVYDSKTEAYLQPFYALATGAAVRMFQSAAQDPDHHFHKHAGDYTLFEIGLFNEQTGDIGTLDSHINLGNAIQLREPLLSAEATQKLQDALPGKVTVLS